MDEQKVAIITGASQGIGAALVSAFRGRGYRVAANSRSIAPSTDPEILTVAGDIGSPEIAEKLAGETLKRFGRIDTLINNAGIFIGKPFIEYSEAEFTRVLSVNLGGFFHITQRVVAAMLKQGNGHILNITASVVDQPTSAVPAALASITKGGLNSVTKSLAIEYAAKGIRVNAVAPGIVKTPMHPENTYEFLSKLSPLGRIAELSEIVDAVIFLESAGFVTGEILHVDGGSNAGCWELPTA
jgi:NAD(P)-dependent dehydrogenase (short-subunit alcohol dehydrogenase family)